MMGKVSLTNVLKKLKMDNICVDTTKADEYLVAHKEFHSDTSINATEQHLVDSFNTKIFYLQQDFFAHIYTWSRTRLQPDLLKDRSNKLQKLAEEIEKNIDLICQLEFLIRDIPVRETKHSIHLILQHLRFSTENEDFITEDEVYLIQKDTPLLVLGCYFQSVKLYDFSYLFTTTETAIICNLFVELCHKAGLDCIKLVIGDLSTVSNSNMKLSTSFNDYVLEVTGIITEKSDVDSAIDTFLNSERHPFPLTRILVQESVYQDFKNIMTWKCRSQQNTDMILKFNSTNAFKYEDKTFYLDYAGHVAEIKNQQDQLIFVEAFRTVNDLLSLLKKSRKQLCMSLWASGVSEANEIAMSVSVPIVWINDYCNFDGPPEVSKAIFDKTYVNGYISSEKVIVEGLTQQQKAWSKKTFNERYEKVIKAFGSANQDISNALKEKNKSYWKLNNFIESKDKTMVMGFHVPIPVVSFWWRYELQHDINHPRTISIWLSVAKALLNGSAVGYNIEMGRNDDVIVDILKMLEKFGLPLIELQTTEPSDFKHKMTLSYHAESVQTKVIWTSFGTTFAN